MEHQTASPDSLLDRLSHHASTTPHKPAISYLSTADPISVSSSLTFSQLHHAALHLATRLLSASSPLCSTPLQPGDRVLLAYPPCSPAFLVSFLACLCGGLVAVPTYPPHPSRKESLQSFVGIAIWCGAKVALTNGEYATIQKLDEMKGAFVKRFKQSAKNGTGAAAAASAAASWPELEWVITDKHLQFTSTSTSHNTTAATRTTVLPNNIQPHSIAFLQYTSGSTSEPKGVSITHNNLSYNLHCITNELQASPQTVVVSWLPQYHDMGLIGSLLGVLYCGGGGYYMSPLAFLARPVRWMEAVSLYGGTHLQAPNFAFGLVARKLNEDEYCFGMEGGCGSSSSSNGKKKKKLDLSCVRHVINGAEPVTESCIDAFERAFAPFGLSTNPSVIYPTYGLAEHTVFVCSGGRGRLTVKRRELEEENKVVIINDGGNASGETTTRLLGCGFPSAQNVDVRIVDPESCICLSEDIVGEIWINSPSKALGYFGKDDITQSEFHAVIQQDTTASDDGYLRTGDLGFFHNQELYVCGRLKDLIIVGGRNYYPQDLEITAESAVDGIRPGCSAAFSINKESEGEDVVLIIELKDPLPKPKELKATCESVASTVRAEISKEFSLSLACIVILKARSVPKTTSGKISRSRAKKAFLSGGLKEVYRSNFAGSNDIIATSTDFNTAASNGNGESKSVPLSATATPPSNIQSLDKHDIKELLLNAICQIANIDKSLVSDTSPLNTFMDSVSLAQFKGMLEGQYKVKPFSDEYLFRDTVTLNKIVEIVKVGEARDDSAAGSVDNGQGASVAAAAGSSGGIAGALGCPPGVVCCTIM